LLATGFANTDQNDLLQYAYRVASAKGDHHGVTDEPWTRLLISTAIDDTWDGGRFGFWRGAGDDTVTQKFDDLVV
jgi:hypothetical protein